MNKYIFGILFFLLVGTSFVYASENNGTIQVGSQYGWGENTGWVNFAPEYAGAYQGLVVTDTSVTGYAWSQTVGWINFSPTNSGQGVSNTSDGHLSGSAWVSGLGWLPMDAVSIDSHGKFTGTAGDTNSTVGRVSFDCDHCTVVTDWRPVSARTPVQSIAENLNTVTSGGAPLPSQPVVRTLVPLTAPPTTTDNLQLPAKSTTVQQGSIGSAEVALSDGGIVKVNFPASTFDDGTTISITPQMVNQSDAPSPGLGTFLVHGTLFNIIATDKNGVIVHNLKKTISISIDIPSDLKSATDLRAYYLDESNSQKKYWVYIPDAEFANGKMIVHVNHLTKFAIFRNTKKLSTITTGAQKSQSKQYLYIAWIIAILILLLCIALWKWGKRKALH